VHAKGWGAFGALMITSDISKYTKAKCLQAGAETARRSSENEDGQGRRPEF